MPNTPLAVTVVVPVFNTRALPASVARPRCSTSPSAGTTTRWSMSTTARPTGSGAFLDDLAAKHPHVRVHHQENSGWPGKPRNVGVAMARGEFVQFVDQDDRLAARALERLVELGRRSSADVVVGKTAGTMVGPRRLFRDGVEGGSVVESGARAVADRAQDVPHRLPSRQRHRLPRGVLASGGHPVRRAGVHPRPGGQRAGRPPLLLLGPPRGRRQPQHRRVRPRGPLRATGGHCQDDRGRYAAGAAP